MTKTRRAVSILIALVTAAALHADGVYTSTVSSDLWFTAGQINGQFWGTLSDEAKVLFLIGYDDGATALAVEQNLKRDDFAITLSSVWTDAKITKGDTKDWLDGFYRRPENRPLPIKVGLMIFYAKLKGKPEGCLDGLATYWRAAANSPEEAAAGAVVGKFCFGAEPKAEPKQPEVTTYK